MSAGVPGSKGRRARKPPRYVQEEATDFKGYVTVVEKVKERWWNHWGERVDPWFRGVSDATYSLVPGMLLDPDVIAEDE
jgi:hypothetical protein